MLIPWTLTSKPPEEPVTLSEVKDHLRLDHSDSDTMLESLITASRQYVEEILNRALVQQTRTAYFKDWPETRSTYFKVEPEQNFFELPGAPLQSVSSVKYTDTDGATSTFDKYEVVTTRAPGRVVLKDGESWPTATLLHESYPINIEYVCGYEADETASPTDYRANIPQSVRNAILLDIELRYDRPPEEYQKRLEQVIHSLLSVYKVW